MNSFDSEPGRVADALVGDDRTQSTREASMREKPRPRLGDATTAPGVSGFGTARGRLRVSCVRSRDEL
ncbi:Uncharacterised protein [Mycobacteroides abscessus subsp. abscessus]|nr:Uncharacterised protein [Mycobacteroides abscessus subsp. abscessus]